jgi:hypothetical protein
MFISIACKFRKTSDYENGEKHELGREFRDRAGRRTIRPEPECSCCGHDADNREHEGQVVTSPQAKNNAPMTRISVTAAGEPKEIRSRPAVPIGLVK